MSTFTKVQGFTVKNKNKDKTVQTSVNAKYVNFTNNQVLKKVLWV